jgi:ubiquinone/menaquinone biosynthesis C-methylase UbiE
MEQPGLQFSGSIARNYDEYFGPMFFEPYARDVGNKFDPDQVTVALEIGCGTGRVTRHLRQSLHAAARLIASDISDDMLTIAKEKIKDAGIEWSVVDGQDLPFEDNSIDLVVCYFGYMVFPDRNRAFSEAQRVLRKGGMLLMATWDKLEHNEASYTFRKIVEEYLGDGIPEYYRLPFSMYEAEAITEILHRAGFSKVSLERVEKKTEAESASQAAQGLATGGPLYHEIVKRNPLWADEVASKLEHALGTKYGKAPMKAPMSAIITRAWK